ncbi:MAG: hypothetical protein MJ178_03465 [Treponemataceae bacterium]|nr:hypothetical protein [Treponemataceae bacterium]
MTYEELNDEIDKAYAKKKSFEQNRSICIVVFAILLYYTTSSARNDDPAWWFYAVMGLMMAVILGILAYGSRQVLNASNRLKELDILKQAEELKMAQESPEEDGDED